MSFRELFISWKFKNTPPPPWRLNSGPLMTNHRMSSLAIIRALKDYVAYIVDEFASKKTRPLPAYLFNP